MKAIAILEKNKIIKKLSSPERVLGLFHLHFHIIKDYVQEDLMVDIKEDYIKLLCSVFIPVSHGF